MKKNYYDEDYPQTNRDKRMTPKKGNSYCGGCDRYLIPDGAKCKCGWVNTKFRLKI